MKRNLVILSVAGLVLSGTANLVNLDSKLENTSITQNVKNQKAAKKVLLTAPAAKSIVSETNSKTQQIVRTNIKPVAQKSYSQLKVKKNISTLAKNEQPRRNKRSINTQLEYMDMDFTIDNSFKSSSDAFVSTDLRFFTSTIDSVELKDFIYNYSKDFIFKNFEIKGNDLYIITKKYVYKIDLRTKKKTKLIRFNYQDSIKDYMFKDDYLYVTTLLDKVYEINLNTKEQIEIASFDKNIVKWIFNDDKLYAIEYYGKVHEINLNTRTKKWIFDSNSRLRIDDLAFVNDEIYAAIEGEIFELNFENKKITRITNYLGFSDLLVINNELYGKSWKSIYKLYHNIQ